MSERTIAWVHRGGEMAASYRLRAAIPARVVAGVNGFRCNINEGAADVLVFSKPYEPDLDLAQRAKAAGCKIVVDLCDDHFGNATKGPLYTEMAQLADAVVVPTDVMATRVREATGVVPAVVIPDPYETPEQPPHADGDELIWFGHNRNLGDLQPLLPLLRGMSIRIVTGPKTPPGTIPWHPDTINTQLGTSNIALLPSRRGAEYKTNNRMLTAIRAGLFCVANYHPAYVPFKDLIWVGNIPTGLRWAKMCRSDLNGLVAQAQARIRDQYAPEVIGAQWAELLGAV